MGMLKRLVILRESFNCKIKAGRAFEGSRLILGSVRPKEIEMSKYNTTSLYRVFVSENFYKNTWREAIYTRSVFNDWKTGSFICVEVQAEEIRPVEIRLTCSCGFDLGWLSVDIIAEEEGVLCDACGKTVGWEGEMYNVVNWDTDEVIKSFKKLSEAKKFCRGLGHLPYDEFTTSYPPIARVDNSEGFTVYNPRFPYEK